MTNTTQLTQQSKARELTHSVVNRLEQSLVAYQAKQKEEAAQLLVGLEPKVTLLEKAAERFRLQAQMASDNYQRLSERVLIIVGNMTTAQANLQTLINNTRAEISSKRARSAATAAIIQSRQVEINNLKAEINNIRGRYEEAAKWSWVPGYGQYLAGRALIDTIEGKIGQIHKAANDLEQAAKRKHQTEAEMAQTQDELAKLVQTVQQYDSQEVALKAQQALLEAQNKSYAKRLAFAMNMTTYYSLLVQDLAGIADHLDSVMKSARRLADKVMSYDNDGKPEQTTMKEALLQLGTDIDTYRQAKGENVHQVDFGFGGKQLGTFLQTGKKEWSEKNAEHKNITYKFTETGRDEWSVYLHDTSRNVSLILDLWTNKVLYSDANTPCREQYLIMGASDRVTGRIAMVVEYEDSASFVEVEPKKWSEIKHGKVAFSFAETHRDDWSVYLYDASRQVYIILDLWTNRIYYSDPNTPRRQQYTVIGAS